MDEEYSESGDTSADMDVSDVDVADDVPADIPDDVPEDDYSEADVADDVSDDVIDETLDDAEFDESIEEDSVEPEADEIDDSIDDIEEDSLDESEDSSEDYEELDDIPEDTDGFDEEQSDQFDDSGEIPEDTDTSEVTEQEETFDEDIPEDVTDAEATDATSDVEDSDTSDQPEDMTDAEATDEVSDVEDADIADQSEDMTDAEATDEVSDVEDADTADQPEDMTDTEEADETSDVEDTDTSEQTENVTDTEESDETSDVEDADTAEQPEDMTDADETDETSDAEDTDAAEQPEDVTDTEEMDAPSDIEDADTTEQAEDVTDTKETDVTSNSEIRSISDYMNMHNYGPDDFETYSQDPQWRQLIRLEYPDYALPEMTQESAYSQLSQYMNDHNYGMDDYAKYSQDPIWRELHSSAFPDSELPPIDDGKQEQKKPTISPSGGGNPPPPSDPNGGDNPPYWVCPVCGQNPCVCDTKDGGSSDVPLPPDDTDKVLVLKRNELDLLKSGNDAINQRLEAKADDYRDKGLSEDEITNRLAADKWEYQKEFLEDAFPGEDVSPHVFNGFNEHGMKDRINEIEKSPFLREIITGKKSDDSTRETLTVNESEKTSDINPAAPNAKGKLDASAINSKYNAENDVPIIPRASDLDRKIIDIFPKNRQAAIDTAFSEAPPELMAACNDFSEGLNHIEDSGYAPNEYGEMVKLGCYYKDGSDTITMDEHMTDAEYSEVFPHEFGHYIDCQRGWESTGKDFTEAIQKDIAMFDKSTMEGKMRFNDMLDDAFSTGAAYDRAVSDIFSAMFKNDPAVVQRFKFENAAYYRHKDQYWDDPGMIQKEIYANNMAIQVSQTRISRNFIERWFGNTDSCFKNKFGLNNRAEV